MLALQRKINIKKKKGVLFIVVWMLSTVSCQLLELVSAMLSHLKFTQLWK